MVVIPATNYRQVVIQQANMPDLGAANSTVPPPNPPATLQTTFFAFQAQPRPLLGEPTVQLTGGTSIDYRDPAVPSALPQTTIGVAPPLNIPPTEQPYFDVLFAPSGSVMYTNQGIICLWVRQPDKVAHPRQPDDLTGFNAAGEQVLVTVYTSNGLIATHPVNSSGFGVGYDPYQYARDGVGSGL
jgi:hypothetical protein